MYDHHYSEHSATGPRRVDDLADANTIFCHISTVSLMQLKCFQSLLVTLGNNMTRDSA